MPAEPPEQTRAIRVGLIYDGAVVDECVVESPRPVSVGGESGATLSVDAEGVPDRYDLFDWTGGEYVLRARSEMTGRLRTAEGIQRLERLARRAAADTGGAAGVSVDGISEGRVEMGDAIVLFQRVTPTASANEPSMPAELKRGVFGTIDGRLAGTVAAAALLQIGFVVWTQLQTWPSARSEPLTDTSIVVADDWSEPPATTKRDEPEKAPVKSTAQQSDQNTAEDDSESTEDESESEQKQKRARAEESNEEPDADERNVSDEAAREGTVLEAIGSEGGEGLLADMETASPGGEFDEALAEGRRGESESSDGLLETGSRSGSDGSGTTVGAGDLDPAPGSGRAGGRIDTGNRSEVGVRCEDCGVEPKPPESGGPGLDVGSVLDRHVGRIRACYERELKKGETSGKVVVSFRVGPEGNPRDVRVERESVDEAVGRCVVGVVRGIDFPAPGERTRRFTKSFVFEPGG